MSWEAIVSDKLKANQYTHKSDAKKDILYTLKIYTDLHPQEDVYVNNDGSSRKYLSLYGTIPVVYKGVTYNIPIQVWLQPGHPFVAPLVFVRPTSSMVVKPSRHVDQSGRLYMPYLTDWRYPKSDTNGMISVLRQIFSQESPVYAKPVNNQATPSNYTTQGPGYPTQSTTGMPMPGMPAPGGYGGRYPGNTPYPPTSQSLGQAPYPVSSPYRPPTSTYQPNVSSTPYPVSNSYQQSSQAQAGLGRLPDRQGSVLEQQHIRASLLSTAEDKLKRRVKEVFEMGKMEIETLEATKSDLEKGHRELTEIVEKMDREKDNLNSNILMLSAKNAEAEEILRKLDNESDSLNIDEAVVTTAPLYNQILNLFAEENAVEDAIYYLSDALRREVIELEAYLKTVRSLSRKQFMLRATLQKARSTAGLTSAVIGH